MSREVLNTTHAAQWLGFPERTVRDWCKKGKLQGAYHSGYDGKYLIPREDLEQLRPCPESLKELVYGD